MDPVKIIPAAMMLGSSRTTSSSLNITVLAVPRSMVSSCLNMFIVIQLTKYGTEEPDEEGKAKAPKEELKQEVAAADSTHKSTLCGIFAPMLIFTCKIAEHGPNCRDNENNYQPGRHI